MRLNQNLFQHHAPRLFVAEDESYAVDAHGLPLVPDEWHVVSQQRRQHWDDSPCVVILGEPGCGKSREFESWCDELRESGQAAFLLPLRDFHRDGGLPRLAGEERRAFAAALEEEASTPLTLFLDALDEGRLRVRDVLQSLVIKLDEANIKRPLRVRLSCRARDWRAALDRNDLAQLFTDQADGPRIKVIEILPLDLGAIRALAAEWLDAEARVNEFIGAAIERNVLALAGHPLTLGMMLQVFKEDGRLGANRTEIFDRACKLLTRENNRIHRDVRRSSTTEEERLRYSQHLAALSVLGNLPNIYVPDADEPTESALPGTLVTADQARLLETLDTSLFTPSLPGTFRFLHPLLADFLAAQWVEQRLADGLRPRALLPLLGGEAGVPTPLRNFAAWLAAFDGRMCAELLRVDPVTLVRGDVGRLSAENRIALVQALAARYAGREFQREVDDFGDLADGLSAELFRELLEPTQSLAVRRMALDMCLAAKRGDMAESAWRIVVNTQENQELREQALLVVCRLAPKDYVSRLIAILDCPPEEDPDDQLAGTILLCLYPGHLSTKAILPFLRPPKIKNFSGRFCWFWEHSFLDRLPEHDEPLLLNELVSQINLLGEISLNDPRPKIYLRVLNRYLQQENFNDLDQITRWIAPLCLRHNDIVLKQAFDSVINSITGNQRLKKSLLEYKPNAAMRDFQYLWAIAPFPRECLQSEDFEWLNLLCRKEGVESTFRIRLFKLLNIAYELGEYMPTSRLDALIELSACYPFFEFPMICELNDKSQWYRIEDAQDQARRKAARNEYLADLARQTENLAKGLVPEILDAVERQRRMSGYFGDVPDLNSLAKITSISYSLAAEQGFKAIWNSPPPEAIAWGHSSDSISHDWLLAASYGLELSEAKNPIEWDKASFEQVEAASIIAIRYLGFMPNWFIRLYEIFPNRIEPRLLKYLVYDFCLEPDDPFSITATLVWAARTSPRLANFLVQFFQTRAFPCNRRCLMFLIRLNLEQPNAAWGINIAKQAQSILSDEPDSLRGSAKVPLLLAAWWLLEWQTAQEFMETDWLNEKAYKFGRIRTFVNEVKNLTGKDDRTWPSFINFSANVAMAPWIYSEPLKPIAESTTNHQVESDSLSIARSAIIRAISLGPPKQARDAFYGFLKRPEFEYDKCLIEYYLDDLERKAIDASWHPPTPTDAQAILSNSARIVRNEAELYWLVEDLCDTDLREILRSDTSLVPLLWDGKKSEGRKPLDEKPLQAVLINQLHLLLKGTPLLHAREPEGFDAKKEDCRLLVTLDNNQKTAIPIEIKQAKHPELWTAPKTQLVEKYMQEPRARFGLYLVGWYGTDQKVADKEKHGYSDATELETALQHHVDKDLANTGKTVRVIVLDCSI